MKPGAHRHRLGARARRRVILGGAAAVPVGAILGAAGSLLAGRKHAGCGPSGDRLTILLGEDLTLGRQHRSLVNAWSQEHTLVEMPSGTDLLRVELNAVGQTGGCAYDVVDVDVAWTAEIAAAGALRPFHNPPTGLLSRATAAGRVGDTTYTIPFTADAALLFYRTDLVDVAHLPRTFREAIETGERLKAQLQADNPVALAGQYADYEGLTVNALEAIWSAGGDPLRIQGRTRSALTHLVAAMRDGAILPDTDEQASVTAFREGRAVFLRNWPFAFGQLYGAPALEGRLGLVALPWPSVLGGHNLGITATSARVEEARDLIGYLTSAGSQDQLLACGGEAPVRAGSYDQTSCPTTPDSETTDRTERGRAHAFERLAAAVRNSLRQAKSRPSEPWYSRYSRVLRRHLYYALTTNAQLDFAGLQHEIDAVIATSAGTSKVTGSASRR